MSWKIDLKGRFLIKRFEDESLVYDRFSGSTHLVDFISSGILQALACGEKSQQEIMGSLSLDYCFPDEKVFLITVEQHLLSLEKYAFISKDTDDTC